MIYQVVYLSDVVKHDIPALSSAARERIRTTIERKLLTQPDLFGAPLRRSLAGYRKLRVGDYRIVFRINGPRVIVCAILHRSVVYTLLQRRIG